jgi:anti-sigma factor RsiW
MASRDDLAGFSAEQLIAYVDGELDEEANAAIEAASAADPALAAELGLLRSGRAVLATAFNRPRKEPLPEVLRQEIEAGFAARRPATPSPAGRRIMGFGLWPALISAAAALAIFLGAGYFAELRVEREIARLERLNAADRVLIRSTVAKALETQLSGTHIEWRNPESGHRGLVEPLRTFRNVQGEWCREYLVTGAPATSPGPSERRRGIACRSGKGLWETRVEMPGET